MQKNAKKFKIIKNKYTGSNLLGKDPTISNDDIEIWNEAMRRLCESFNKPESFEKLAYKNPVYYPKLKLQ
ncbi:MAG: hypothetical protein ACP5OE_08805 [Thermodesulfobium sp.]